MELEKTKQLVAYYEDKIIINFESHFNYLVLEDFYSGGYNERISDHFFYKEYFSRYEEGIISLLLAIENNFEVEFIDLKLRLINLKRIIDTKLANEKNEKNDSFKKVRKSQFIINSRININRFITLLYDKLIENKLIEIDKNSFELHFSTNWLDKIKWLGTELQITNLIYQLLKKKYLDSELELSKHRLVSLHFLNRYGKEFKQKQLGAVFSEKNQTIPQDDIIYKIVFEISEEL